MFLDVFGIYENNADEKKMFLDLFGSEFKQVEFTQHGGEEFEKHLFIFFACRRCHFNSTEQLKQEKTNLSMLHVQDNVAGQTACSFCVSCVERNRGYCSEAVVNLGCFSFSYARRGVRPTQFDASARY